MANLRVALHMARLTFAAPTLMLQRALDLCMMSKKKNLVNGHELPFLSSKMCRASEKGNTAAAERRSDVKSNW
ncbi:hypothetical protein GcM1_02620 [Golovinomyces cichoracearum]|uniref:Secreted protein n=1 Tax=Golovinomyces cichoracearum TaxID=62708 RepID=A0A420IL83_9PEZI|nr:hypothetical protein GcM1_02620 [Golovinomyces cichoracearum]